MKNICKLSLILAGFLLILTGCYSDKGNYDDVRPGYRPDPNYQQSGDKFTDYGENQFVMTSKEPVSTFSVDCDGASYAIMRRMASFGQRPPVAAVRIEEYLNYFTFDYPEPESGEMISVDTEVAQCPWNSNNLIMRIGIKGKTIHENYLPASNYVFLIDVSGSMSSSDKLDLLKRGFNEMVDALDAKDRVAIVVYAGSAGVVLPSTSCEDKARIKQAINSLRAGGATAGGQGIFKAYEIAERNYINNGNNRVIIGSDGDFNVGVTSTTELVKLIESKRDNGIYLTVLGVGSGNLNDSMMEQLADKGNGNYEYIDNMNQLLKVFVKERNKFHVVAKDTKLQVTFDPEQVQKYRLIGYENRIMKEEDFENDKKDAGDIGVGQTVTAMYEIVPTLGGNLDGKYAQLDVNYKPNDGITVGSNKISMNISGMPKYLDEISENTRFAASVAAFGMLMKNSGFSGSAKKELVVSLGENAKTFDPNGYRSEYIEIVKYTYLK